MDLQIINNEVSLNSQQAIDILSLYVKTSQWLAQAKERERNNLVVDPSLAGKYKSEDGRLEISSNIPLADPLVDREKLPEEYLTRKLVPNAIALPDGRIFEQVENPSYYVDGDKVMTVEPNMKLIKANLKLGADISGVTKQTGTPRISIKLDGETVK